MKRNEKKMEQDSQFNFTLPMGYKWLIDNKLVGFDAFSSFQPWYFIPPVELFGLERFWPNIRSSKDLVVFARRQDNDEMACFEVVNNIVTKVHLIKGWTDKGFDILESFDSVWDWLKLVIDDLAEWYE